MAIEDKNFADLNNLEEYDSFLKQYIDKLLAKQSQEIENSIQESTSNLIEFFDL